MGSYSTEGWPLVSLVHKFGFGMSMMSRSNAATDAVGEISMEDTTKRRKFRARRAAQGMQFGKRITSGWHFFNVCE